MIREDVPNEETIEAFAEGGAMLENDTGQRFVSTADLFAALEG